MKSFTNLIKHALVLSAFTAITSINVFAQAVDPSQIADEFILCTSQSQTQQLVVPIKNGAPVMGQFIVTDVPGSQNVLEMIQLDVTNATFNDQVVSVQAAGIIDSTKTFDITANAVGEFNITPAFKTLIYLGSLNRTGAAAEGFTCLVLTADELSQLAPQP